MKMEIRSVLVEKEDKKENKLLGSSGVMLREKYVIITANIVLDEHNMAIFEKLEPGKLYPELFLNYNSTVNVVWNEDELFVVKKAYIFSPFISGSIRATNKHIFQSWAIDSIDNTMNLNNILSLFFILCFENTCNIEDLKNTLREWWHQVESVILNKGYAIYIRSSPFGNRNFIDSYSNGIISNILGNNSCLILSDCPSTPGSEGGLLCISSTSSSKHANTELAIGIVLSSISWWKGEWVGLTLIADIRSVIVDLIDIPLRMFSMAKIIPDSKIIATTESSLVQVYSEKNWGTAILLNEDKEIFITNSHVVDDGKLYFFHKDRSWSPNLLYRTSEGNALDLAIIKSDTNVLKEVHLKHIKISRKKYKLGDCVFSAGFSIFTKDSRLSPTLTKGCISQINTYMLKTTCCIHPGASGGAILDDEGALLAIIVSNIKLHENNVIYPRVNMAIPFSVVEDILFEYIKTGDITILSNLDKKNQQAEKVWKRLEGKL